MTDKKNGSQSKSTTFNDLEYLNWQMIKLVCGYNKQNNIVPLIFIST